MPRHRHGSSRSSVPVVSAEQVATWPPSKINSMLDRLAKFDSELTSEFIESGRGHERPSDIWQKDDPLAERYKTISRAQHTLHAEISRRYGPNAPSRLPRGFGPIRY